MKSAFLTSGTGCLATTSESQKLFLDSSTIDAKSSLEVGEAVAKSGIGEFTDAPVSVPPLSIYQSDPTLGRCQRCRSRNTGIHVRCPRLSSPTHPPHPRLNGHPRTPLPHRCSRLWSRRQTRQQLPRRLNYDRPVRKYEHGHKNGS